MIAISANIDPEGDQIVPYSEAHILYCINCKVEMISIGKNSFKCPKCGKIYAENQLKKNY